MDNSKVVTLMRFNVLGRAEIYKSLLESNGIRASLTHDMIQSVLPLGSSGASPIELIVLEKDAEKARKILAANFDEDEFAQESKPKPRKK